MSASVRGMWMRAGWPLFVIPIAIAIACSSDATPGPERPTHAACAAMVEHLIDLDIQAQTRHATPSDDAVNRQHQGGSGA